VAGLLRERAPAKVNLTLRIVGRRRDGYHELESLVAFADLADVLTFEPRAPADILVTGPFAAATGPAGENLVLKAARAMNLDGGRFTLEKNIPVAAGLGGGSADAAAALRLIAQANGMSLDDPRLRDAARACGADVPVCLVSRARVMRGIGDELSAPIRLPPVPAVLVHPRVHLPTKDVFAAFDMNDASEPAEEMPSDPRALLGWLAKGGNDLTRAAISLVPAVAEILQALAALPGCRIARMSGSGAACFGLFSSAQDAEAAERRLHRVHDDWWMCRATLG
jgi:4-diphosphocytidyl-2-C-methyl-D-erythritol kinase